jgi:hypothetical protein
MDEALENIKDAIQGCVDLLGERIAAEQSQSGSISPNFGRKQLNPKHQLFNQLKKLFVSISFVHTPNELISSIILFDHSDNFWLI